MVGVAVQVLPQLHQMRHQAIGCKQHAAGNQAHADRHRRVHRHAGEVVMHRRGHHVHRHVQTHAHRDRDATDPESQWMMEGDAVGFHRLFRLRKRAKRNSCVSEKGSMNAA